MPSKLLLSWRQGYTAPRSRSAPLPAAAAAAMQAHLTATPSDEPSPGEHPLQHLQVVQVAHRTDKPCACRASLAGPAKLQVQLALA